MGHNAGSALEMLVENSVFHAEKEGLSLKRTTPPFVGRVDKSGKAIGYLAAKGGLDFTGDLWGQAVYLDCKVTAKPRLAFDETCLKPHQIDIVREAHSRGAIAFFLVELVDGLDSDYWALDWGVIAPFWVEFQQGGRKSIPALEVKARAHPVKLKAAGLDILGAVKAIRERRKFTRHA